jgi:hypothetical protein
VLWPGIISLLDDVPCARCSLSHDIRRCRKLIALYAAFCPTWFDATVFIPQAAAWLIAAARQKNRRSAAIGEE